MRELNRVLLVDDDEDIRVVARLALETVGGLQVMDCSSSAEATVALESFEPDLILLDVNMPAEDGPSLLRRLHRQGTHPAVVFLTARASDDDRHRYVAMGAAAVVAKPFDPMQLASTLRQIYRDQAGD